MDSSIRPFDVGALYRALDARRTQHGLSWKGVADQLWELSSELNERRRDHPISPSTLTSMAKKPRTSCQRHAEALTWPQLAARLGCSPNQLTGLRTAKYATDMELAMRIVQWTGRPAADFVYPAAW